MLTQFTARLKTKQKLTPEVLFLDFKLLDPKEINFSAGQYIILEVPKEKDKTVKRLYSIASSSAEKNKIELIIKLIPDGIGSCYLNNLNIGDKIKFSGPAGFFVFKNTPKPKVFLATGTGISPIRSMLLSYFFKKRKESALLFWGLKTKKDVPLKIQKELEKIKTINNFNYFFCLSREESKLSPPYLQGRIQESALNYLKKLPENTEFYICGGRKAVEDIKIFLLEKLKVKKQLLHFEKF